MRKLKSLFLVVLIAGVLSGCAKHVQAPVPGTINTFDAFAARTIGDAHSALIATKTWEFCSDQKFPPTVVFDANTYLCDASAGPFPAVARPVLFRAEQSYNAALAAAQAYHSGATSDTVGLTQAITQLGIDIGNMFTSAGKGK